MASHSPKRKASVDERPEPIRKAYEGLGVETYYRNHGQSYRNPHEKIIRTLVDAAVAKDYVGANVLDLCCGSGEVTLALGEREVLGVDPFTDRAYFDRTGKHPLPYTFHDIGNGLLQGSWDTVFCSFALHLCPKSLLPAVLWQIGQLARTLIVITPNKMPDCDGVASWLLVEEMMESRVRMRVYLR